MVDQISSELDYMPKYSSEPFYEYSLVFPQSGTTTAVITAGGNQQSIFEIPPGKAFNFAKSWLQFKIIFTDAVNFDHTWCFADFIAFFRQIVVTTRSGVQLLNLNDANMFSKLTMKPHKSLNDSQHGYLIGIGTNTQKVEPCVSNNSLALNTFATVRYNGTQSNSKHLIEPTYLWRGVAAADTLELNVNIPFKYLFETILGLDNDLYFNETLLVKFTWDSLSGMAFANRAASPGDPIDPSTGARALVGPANVSELEMHLAIEKNLDIVTKLMEKVNSPGGLNLMIDYIYNSSTGLTGENQSVSIRINRENGRYLEKIYHTICAAEVPNTSKYGNDNLAGNKPTSFYTNLNNNKLMQYDYTTLKYDDYFATIRLNSSLNDSSLIGLNMYYYNWCWTQDFSSGAIDTNDNNLIRGIDLNTGEQKWDFVARCANAPYTHYTYVLCKRMLKIGAMISID